MTTSTRAAEVLKGIALVNFESSIRSIERSLVDNTILVSDALIALVRLVEMRSASHELVSGRRNSYTSILEIFNNELHGYSAPTWNMEMHYRRCTAELVLKPRSETEPCQVLSNTRFVMILGAPEIEAQLALELDLDVLRSGRDADISAELEAVGRRDVQVYTDSGITDELWLRFNIMEMVRVYFQMKALVTDICKITANSSGSERQTSIESVFSGTVSAPGAQRFSSRMYMAISDAVTFGDCVQPNRADHALRGVQHERKV